MRDYQHSAASWGNRPEARRKPQPEWTAGSDTRLWRPERLQCWRYRNGFSQGAEQSYRTRPIPTYDGQPCLPSQKPWTTISASHAILPICPCVATSAIGVRKLEEAFILAFHYPEFDARQGTLSVLLGWPMSPEASSLHHSDTQKIDELPCGYQGVPDARTCMNGPEAIRLGISGPKIRFCVPQDAK